MSWETMKLSECCVSITDGDHLPPPKADRGIPFVTIANINSTNQFDFANTMFVPEEYYDRLDNKRKAKVGDVLYSVVGSFGIPVYIKEDKPFVFQRHIAILRPNEKILPRFLYYTMLSKTFYAKADAAAIGAAQRTVSLTALRNIEIDVPTAEEQHKITDILSAYDDLIENNQKQIKLLEEAAQRLYKEWFVDLRFPGHENTPIIDGVLEGWKKGSAESFFEITIGKTPPRAEEQWFTNMENGTPWVSISDMGETSAFIYKTSEGLTRDAVQRHNVKIIPKDTILLSFKLTVGRVAIATTDMCTNEAIAHFRMSDPLYREYIYCYLKNYHYDSLGSTSSISKPFRIVKTTTGQKYNFGADSAALYEHNIFMYEYQNSVIAIFHRQSGSGCKSVFSEVAGKMLREKGMKLDMELYLPLVPPSDNNIQPTKIQLQYVRNIVSSDVAENISKKKRVEVIQELGLNLESRENSVIKNILQELKIGRISKELAFARIKQNCPHTEIYNDAEIFLRIGKRQQKIRWGEFDTLLGNYDITVALHNRFKSSGDYIGALSAIADEYYDTIINEENLDE